MFENLINKDLEIPGVYNWGLSPLALVAALPTALTVLIILTLPKQSPPYIVHLDPLIKLGLQKWLHDN